MINPLVFVEAIPKKVYAIAVVCLLAAALVLTLGLQAQRLATSKVETKLSQEQTSRAQETAERERTAREDAQEVARMGAKHASLQQEILYAFHSREAADVAHDRTLLADLDVLRDVVRHYAAGSGPKAESDAAAGRGEDDRARRLGALVEEALGLSRESEGFIRQRDREVKLLKDVITNDRRLVPEEGAQSGPPAQP